VQLADHNLLPSEQLGVVGHDSVRGYDERVANGSEGELLSAELRSPAFSLLGTSVSEMLDDSAADQAQLLAFWDYGQVRDKQANPSSPNGIHLSSIGVGARYSISRYLDLRLDYGHQIIPLPGANLGNAVHVSLTVGY
jgi:hemolysin activation/secretion protein